MSIMENLDAFYIFYNIANIAAQLFLDEGIYKASNVFQGYSKLPLNLKKCPIILVQ